MSTTIGFPGLSLLVSKLICWEQNLTHASIVFNVSGQKDYPKWTNHFDRKDLSFFFGLGAENTETNVNLANSILFMKAQRNAVIISNIGIAAMVWGITYASSVYGVANVIKYYGFPWLEVSHWCKPHSQISEYELF